MEGQLGATVRVLYPGSFDLLHQGHLNALTVARQLAGPDGTLMVGVNSDTLMRHYKRPPQQPDQKRVYQVQRTGLADHVFTWHGPTGQDKQILQTLPDLYIAGTDWLSKDLAQQLGIDSLAWFDYHDISLLFLRRTPGISTTQLIAQHER